MILLLDLVTVDPPDSVSGLTIKSWHIFSSRVIELRIDFASFGTEDSAELDGALDAGFDAELEVGFDDEPAGFDEITDEMFDEALLCADADDALLLIFDEIDEEKI